MELVKHAESVSDRKKSLFVLLWCYFALAVFLIVYTFSITSYRSKRSEEIYSVVFQPANFQSVTNENQVYSAPPPPPSQLVEKIPEVVDSIPAIENDTIFEEEIEDKNNQNTGNENSENGNSEEGTGYQGYGDPSGIFIIAEKMPSFPGGEFAMRRFIAENVIYPREANKKGIEGIVYVRFCVTSSGAIEQVSIAHGVDPMLDAEALRVVESMPVWIPGEQRGRKVSVWFTVSINFQLN